MDTATLKTFATRARTDLITEVSAGIRRVLAPASPERVEQPGAVAALEKAVSAAGGGEAGRAAVADKVAYTWFNRIIALRFMDANGYTGIGVVSPARGQAGGQPEILAEAKHGTIDTTVVTNQQTVETVTGLLDGTRRGEDPQGEAYALLLAEYCRYWNRAMPFMFEREGDYTELLIPANLLADDSVLARAVATLTEDVCGDVEVIGWLYQFYISERKDEVFAGFKKNKKAGAAEIPPATQLFTPHWIVRYVVENTLGRLWLLNRPSSRLAEQMDYYIAPVDEETDFLKIAGPEELKIIDPACGSGHMLTYAFDLLYAIYQEEGYAPSDIPSLILTHNLYGTEIDPRAGALAAFALTMKARSRQRTYFNKGVQPNICVIEPETFTPFELDMLATSRRHDANEETFWNKFEHAETLGSLVHVRNDLIEPLRRRLDDKSAANGDLLKHDLDSRGRRVITQATYLSRRYHVVVANPPYMGSKNIGSALDEYLNHEYREYRSDLFSAFCIRMLDMLQHGGMAGIVTPNVWFYLKGHRALRNQLVGRNLLLSAVELPLGAISGATVQVCAFCVRKGATRGRTTFIRLVDSGSRGPALAVEARRSISSAGSDNRYVVDATTLNVIDGHPLAYWASRAALRGFAQFPPLGSMVVARVAMATGDNNAFVRTWAEVSRSRVGIGAHSEQEAKASGKRWFPVNRGGEFRKWYGNREYVIDWEDSGRRIRSLTGPPSLGQRSPIGR